MTNSNFITFTGDTPYGAVDALDGVVFALDVGTRTIVGVVGRRMKSAFRVIAAEVYEHDKRVMFDGQIHDINEVARCVAIVRERLEKRVGFKLESAYIAAAGRVLKTVRVEAGRELSPDREIDWALLHDVEVEALLSARKLIEARNDVDKDAFDFVGYAATGMYLDGYPMTNLLGHSGLNVRIEFIATFLVHAVTSSLFTVMRQVGLVVAGITLEPIAALDAVVSRDNRRLNLALIDIGAGTSDIALTKDGNIFSYNMVPCAGDKVTDCICGRFLTDFLTGEHIKHALYARETEITYSDIFGRENKTSYGEVLETVSPIICEIAETVARAIINDNKVPPAAAIVVGGGCRLPDFEARLSEALGVNIDRVAVRDRSAIIGLECDLDELGGPDSITPFGIALYGAGRESGFNGDVSIRLNNKPVRLSGFREHSVSDVLIAGAFKHARLIEKAGKRLSFFLNEEVVTFSGGPGRQAEIRVNGNEAWLDTAVKPGDDITVTDAVDGGDARVFVGDLYKGYGSGAVTYAGDSYILTPQATINGEERDSDAEVFEGDIVDLTERLTIRTFIDEYLNGAPGTVFYVNGRRTDGEYLLKPGDDISIRDSEENFVENGPPETYKRVGDEAKGAARVSENKKSAGEKAVTTGGTVAANQYDINGNILKIDVNTSETMLIDVLPSITVEGSDQRGWLALAINGAPAKLTDRIFSGDRIEISWEREQATSGVLLQR